MTTMPIGLQVANIEKRLARDGVESDLVDVRALLDSTLSYRENLELVLREVGKRKEDEHTRAFAAVASAPEGAVEQPYVTGRVSITPTGKVHDMRDGTNRTLCGWDLDKQPNAVAHPPGAEVTCAQCRPKATAIGGAAA